MNPTKPWRRNLGLIAALALYTLIVFGMHEARGATHSGFGSFDDEPSHLVTGLMFRDYFAAGLPGSPRAFAENYYVHYPKVGIGQWPPVFYAIEGLWILAMGESPAALLGLMSLLTALLATAVFAALRREWNPTSAFLLGVLVCSAPLMQRMSSVLMTEIPLALFCLLAALQFGRFMDTARARHAFAFAMFAILAILTKGNALALGLLPVLAIAFSGQWMLLRRPALWISGALVAVVCAPWYWITVSISASTWAGGSSPTIDYASRAGAYYTTGLLAVAGIGTAVFAVLGMFARPVASERGTWASMLALLLAVILFHCAIPSSIELRHLALVVAPWILLAGVGLRWMTRRRAFRTLQLTGVAPGLLLAAFFVQSFELPVKDNQGYRQAIAHIVAHPELEHSRILIASDSKGEGLMIAAGALAGDRTGRVFLRGTKVLGSSTWTGLDYEPAFANADEIMAYMAGLPVGVVALDLSTRRHQWFAHMDMLQALVETRTDMWEPIGIFDVFRDGRHFSQALRLYRQIGHEQRPVAPVDFETLYNRTL